MYNDHPLCSAKNSAKLYVVTAISNPKRYQSRYKLYENFAKMVNDAGAIPYTVETAFGHRPHIITQKDNAQHIQLRTSHELWHKENMLNIGFSRLPSNWEYAAWIDADVVFAKPNWAAETIHALQHYDVVQMFSHAFDLGPDHTPFNKTIGFMKSYHDNLEEAPSYYSYTWHPGYAWAIRRSAFDHLGGLIDYAVLGAADRHMAHALIGSVEKTIHVKLTDNYKNELLVWQQRAEKHIRRNVGFVPGALLHYWHGKKRDRKYVERWKILVDNEFDPKLDLKKDWQGLYQLTDRSITLRDQLRNYFAARNEDSIDLE
jgi:hypothetical protein